MRSHYLAWQLAVAIAGTFSAATPSKAEPCLDVALVLAVDVSGSIDASEYALQIKGIAAAFRDQEVLAAIRNAGQVAGSVVFWADTAMPVVTIGWSDVGTEAGAEKLALSVESTPRELGGSTGLGRGVWEALDLLDGLCANRKLINVSGDGSETITPKHYSGSRSRVPLHAARKRAEDLGITVNALAITDSQRDIANYFKTYLITGPGAFVMEVGNYSNFADAIKMKLIREIEPSIARLPERDLFAALLEVE